MIQASDGYDRAVPYTRVTSHWGAKDACLCLLFRTDGIVIGGHTCLGTAPSTRCVELCEAINISQRRVLRPFTVAERPDLPNMVMTACKFASEKFGYHCDI